MLNAPLAGIGEPLGNLNGLIPATFADQIIKFRLPYSMPGELDVAANTTGTQFNANTFLHNIDKPIEIHRVHFELIGILDGTILEPQPTTLDLRVRVTLLDTSKNEVLTKNPHLIRTIQKLNEHTWEWEVPYTLTRQEGITITVDTLAFPAGTNTIRVAASFQGYLIVLAPPSDGGRG